MTYPPQNGPGHVPMLGQSGASDQLNQDIAELEEQISRPTTPPVKNGPAEKYLQVQDAGELPGSPTVHVRAHQLNAAATEPHAAIFLLLPAATLSLLTAPPHGTEPATCTHYHLRSHLTRAPADLHQLRVCQSCRSLISGAHVLTRHCRRRCTGDAAGERVEEHQDGGAWNSWHQRSEPDCQWRDATWHSQWQPGKWAKEAGDRKTQRCRNFDKGYCWRGDRCRYFHDDGKPWASNDTNNEGVIGDGGGRLAATPKSYFADNTGVEEADGDYEIEPAEPESPPALFIYKIVTSNIP